MGRKAKFIIAVGETGAGKSTLIAKMVQAEVGNAIVLKHDTNIDDKAFRFLTEKTMSNWRQGADAHTPVKCKFSCLDDEEYLEFIKWLNKKNVQNGTIVLDDLGCFELDKSTKPFKLLLRMRRHIQQDIICMYHGLSEVPIDLFKFCTEIILFNTTDNFFYKNHKMPKFDRLVQADQQVKINVANPKTQYTPVIIPMRF